MFDNLYTIKQPDVSEDLLGSVDGLLETLLEDHAERKDEKDKERKHHIIWATDDNDGHPFGAEIQVEAITGQHGQEIQPRVCKSRSVQDARRRLKGEVMTPPDVVKEQNDLVEEYWNLHHAPDDWRAYVQSPVLEIACGEGPYLTTRYDVVSGQYIDVPARQGLLDRKLRRVNQHTGDVNEWRKWVTQALKATYGFEWQGDSLLLARENVICSVIEHYMCKFRPHEECVPLSVIDHELELASLAYIVSWNLWQMDALKGVVPNSCKPTPTLFREEPDSCPGCATGVKSQHNGHFCRIRDWQRFDAGEKDEQGKLYDGEFFNAIAK